MARPVSASISEKGCGYCNEQAVFSAKEDFRRHQDKALLSQNMAATMISQQREFVERCRTIPYIYLRINGRWISPAGQDYLHIISFDPTRVNGWEKMLPQLIQEQQIAIFNIIESDPSVKQIFMMSDGVNYNSPESVILEFRAENDRIVGLAHRIPQGSEDLFFGEIGPPVVTELEEGGRIYSLDVRREGEELSSEDMTRIMESISQEYSFEYKMGEINLDPIEVEEYLRQIDLLANQILEEMKNLSPLEVESFVERRLGQALEDIAEATRQLDDLDNELKEPKTLPGEPPDIQLAAEMKAPTIESTTNIHSDSPARNETKEDSRYIAPELITPNDSSLSFFVLPHSPEALASNNDITPHEDVPNPTLPGLDRENRNAGTRSEQHGPSHSEALRNGALISNVDSALRSRERDFYAPRTLAPYDPSTALPHLSPEQRTPGDRALLPLRESITERLLYKPLTFSASDIRTEARNNKEAAPYLGQIEHSEHGKGTPAIRARHSALVESVLSLNQTARNLSQSDLHHAQNMQAVLVQQNASISPPNNRNSSNPLPPIKQQSYKAKAPVEFAKRDAINERQGLSRPMIRSNIAGSKKVYMRPEKHSTYPKNPEARKLSRSLSRTRQTVHRLRLDSAAGKAPAVMKANPLKRYIVKLRSRESLSKTEQNKLKRLQIYFQQLKRASRNKALSLKERKIVRKALRLSLKKHSRKGATQRRLESRSIYEKRPSRLTLLKTKVIALRQRSVKRILLKELQKRLSNSSLKHVRTSLRRLLSNPLQKAKLVRFLRLLRTNRLSSRKQRRPIPSKAKRLSLNRRSLPLKNRPLQQLRRIRSLKLSLSLLDRRGLSPKEFLRHIKALMRASKDCKEMGLRRESSRIRLYVLRRILAFIEEQEANGSSIEDIFVAEDWLDSVLERRQQLKKTETRTLKMRRKKKQSSRHSPSFEEKQRNKKENTEEEQADLSLMQVSACQGPVEYLRTEQSIETSPHSSGNSVSPKRLPQANISSSAD